MFESTKLRVMNNAWLSFAMPIAMVSYAIYGLLVLCQVSISASQLMPINPALNITQFIAQ